MRPLRSIAFTLLTLAAAPAASAGGWYVEALVGANFPDDVDFGIDAGAIETSLDDGYLWGFGFGYQFTHVRLNAELDTSREADVDVHGLDGVEQAGSLGEIQSEAGMGNVLFDFNKGKRISPYVGAGIGLAEIELNDLGTDGIPTIVDAEDTVFAWQILGGVGIDVGEHWIVDFSLRYYATAEGDFDTTPAGGGQPIQVDYSAFSVTAGFRYKF